MPVEVVPSPCSQAELEAHLRAFVRAFVVKERQARCLHILVEEPKKARDELRRLPSWLDPRTHEELQGSDGFPGPLQARFGPTRGIYFNESTYAAKLTAAQAATLAAEDSSDAILSLRQGRTALVFEHHGSVFLCHRDEEGVASDR